MKTLVRIVLVNWFVCGAQDIDIIGNTAFSGINGSGKSSIMDGIQFSFNGNRSNMLALNASANVTAVRRTKKDERSVREYSLGLVNGRQLRESAISYCALVYVDSETQRRTTIGSCCSASDASPDLRMEGCFTIDDFDLRTSDLIDSENMPLEYDQFRTVMSAQSGFTTFPHRSIPAYVAKCMSLLSGAGGVVDGDRYLRAVRNALRFDPQGSADEFVRNFMMEQRDLDVEGLRGLLDEWRRLQEHVKSLQAEATDLHLVEGSFANLVKRESVSASMDWVRLHAGFVAADTVYNGLAGRDIEGEAELVTATAARDASRAQLDNVREEIASLKRMIAGSGGQERASLVERMATLTGEAKASDAAVVRLSRSVEKILSSADAIAGVSEQERTYPVLASATGDALRVIGVVRRLAGGGDLVIKDAVDASIDAVAAVHVLSGVCTAHEAHLSREIAVIETDAVPLIAMLGDLRRGGEPLWPAVRSAIAALADSGIAARALSSLVDVTDESWRLAVETQLGAARQSLVVPEGRVSDAYAVLKRKGITGASIVNLGDGRVPEVRDRTLAQVIATDDPTAAAFIAARLGGIVRAENDEELRRLPRAMTRDGGSSGGFTLRLQRAEQVFVLGRTNDPSRIGDIQARIAENDALIRPLRARLDALRKVSRSSAVLDAISFDDVLADAADGAAAAAMLKDVGSRIALIDAKTDVDDLRTNITGLESDIPPLVEQLRDDEKALMQIHHARGRASSELEAARVARGLADSELQAFVPRTGFNETRAAADYASLLGVHGTPMKVAQTAARESKDAEAALPRLRADALQRLDDVVRQHASPDPLPRNLASSSYVDWITQRLRVIEDDDLINYEANVSTTRSLVEEQVRTKLLLELRSRIDAARRSIDDVNDVLKNKIFHGERYKFQVNLDRDYRDIVEVADQIANETIDASTLFAVDKTVPASIASGIRRIMALLEKGDEADMLTDYRNYLRFELVTSDATTDRAVSTLTERQAKGSGGEKQVPFYITVAAALSSICHKSETDPKRRGFALALFDEAFSALDPNNVSSALQTVAEFGVQIIANAPVAHIGSFMKHMDTIVNVSRVGDRMQLDVIYPKLMAREHLIHADPNNLTLDDVAELARIAGMPMQ